MESLLRLGYSPWFKNQVDAEMKAAHEVARVISVHKDSYVITKEVAVVFAELSGHLSYTANSVTDLPTTGDWVYADFYDDDTHAIIHGVISRKTLLKRKQRKAYNNQPRVNSTQQWGNVDRHSRNEGTGKSVGGYGYRRNIF